MCWLHVAFTEPSFQRTKERRSLRGRVAALVRHGVVGTSANTETVPQTPKTFGIPLHTCVMSSLHEVSYHQCSSMVMCLVASVCLSLSVCLGFDF